ncbi:protease HtpX [Helicobacter cinaedi]|uniref:zinc metalloprotease HtpX n=1 Tax=Helicobacter cinaedi TaxID=213 RepID=UPI001F1F8413|nr:zinc metalloprotease HtpX [Helicobacter cinaedi]BDB66779.1 protease HtpX [Helicobacter cinaedi]
MDSRFERIIRQNQLKTYAVLCVYIAIFVFIGLLADIIRLNSESLQEGFYLLLSLQEFPLITFIMGVVAFGVIMYSVGQFSRIMLSGNEYKRINPNLVLSRRESTLYGVFSDLLKSANCPFEPALYIIEAPYMNAFASGWNEKNSMIAITSTLLERLKEDELKAVIAHELSHIRHGDVRLTMCVGILSNIMLLGVNIFAFYFSSSNSQGARVARNILLVLQFILPLLTMVLSLFISRNREYMADSGAAYLMRDSEPMIRALQKISQDYAQNTYTEPNPTRASAYLFETSEILSTHPSIQNRIKSLLGQRF